MDSKTRLINALELKHTDRLPVTTHHVMEYFLNSHLNHSNEQEFFDQMGLDPILWIDAYKRRNNTDYVKDGMTQNDHWRVTIEEVKGQEYKTLRYLIDTPKKQLSMIKQFNQHTNWVVEHLVKEKQDIEIIGEYAPIDICDVDEVNRQSDKFGNRGLVRGVIPSFPLFGQPGCWQDLSCLYGIEKLILETFDDPSWVHDALGIIQKRKQIYVKSLKHAKFDIIELGGGDASTTVISPKMFNEFVMPYDGPIIEAAKGVGQRIAYHTCGGMMPILEDLASMKPTALETFTPVGMGGDVDLKEAKRRIGDKVCMIGGFDQGHYFIGCTEKETRALVRKCFEEAGEGGGFILSPSDHFFDAEPKLIQAFADEAKKCTYE